MLALTKRERKQINMKKLLVVGLSACLLLSFTGSAFAATKATVQTKHTVTHAKKKVTTAKKTTKANSKNYAVSKNKKAKAVHKKTTKTAKTA
ncbi:hypothetical protein SAMN05443246_4613 [Paenibacillus sp. GP183]|nr:hypothetical protein SAMN05443246_4613 [Paenibacillus sp. GP183]